ncbi:MAG: hypothetical protein K1000chlam1_00589, partial [Candidatus Anoxychlamydiales bacterium]|nr:hypothetical protein [Candidatus Anoxychlamydiales bacterium]
YAIFRDASVNIKIFGSLDFGLTWIDMDSTDTFFGNGINPQIITSSTGSKIYGAWDGATLPITTGLRSFFPLNSVSINR